MTAIKRLHVLDDCEGQRVKRMMEKRGDADMISNLQRFT